MCLIFDVQINWQYEEEREEKGKHCGKTGRLQVWGTAPEERWRNKTFTGVAVKGKMKLSTSVPCILTMGTITHQSINLIQSFTIIAFKAVKAALVAE